MASGLRPQRWGWLCLLLCLSLASGKAVKDQKYYKLLDVDTEVRLLTSAASRVQVCMLTSRLLHVQADDATIKRAYKKQAMCASM